MSYSILYACAVTVATHMHEWHYTICCSWCCCCRCNVTADAVISVLSCLSMPFLSLHLHGIDNIVLMIQQKSHSAIFQINWEWGEARARNEIKKMKKNVFWLWDRECYAINPLTYITMVNVFCDSSQICIKFYMKPSSIIYIPSYSLFYFAFFIFPYILVFGFFVTFCQTLHSII